MFLETLMPAAAHAYDLSSKDLPGDDLCET